MEQWNATEEYDNKGNLKNENENIIAEFDAGEIKGSNQPEENKATITQDSKNQLEENKATITQDSKNQPEENKATITQDGKSQSEEAEFEQLGGAMLLEPHSDGRVDMTPVGANRDIVPQKIAKELSVIKNNVIDKDALAARLHEVTNESLDTIMSSVELLTNTLDKLNIPYDKSKNLIVNDRNGAKIAYCLTENIGNNIENDGENRDVLDNMELKKNENRIRDIGNVDINDMHAIINAEDKNKFNKIVDNINSSRENTVDISERNQHTNARENNGMDMSR